MSKETDFLALYHRSKPRKFQLMRETCNLTRRKIRAKALNDSIPVDNEIDIGLASPLVTMAQRVATGTPWVRNAFMAPLPPGEFATGPCPAGCIPTSLNPSDYPAVNPVRRFDLADVFRLYFHLGDLCHSTSVGLATQNPDRHWLINRDAEECRIEDLIEVNPGISPVYEGALLHYGIALKVPGHPVTRIFDAEHMSIGLAERKAQGMADVDALFDYVQAYLAEDAQVPPVPGDAFGVAADNDRPTDFTLVWGT